MNDSFSKNIFFMLAEIFTHEIFFMRLLKVFQTLKLVFSIFLHFTKRKDSRKYEKYCLVHLKGPPFSFSRYSNFCNFLPFIPTFSRFNGLYETGIILTLSISKCNIWNNSETTLYESSLLLRS